MALSVWFIRINQYSAEWTGHNSWLIRGVLLGGLLRRDERILKACAQPIRLAVSWTSVDSVCTFIVRVRVHLQSFSMRRSAPRL